MRSRLSITLVAAVALHAGVLAAVRARRALEAKAEARAEHAEIDLDLVPPEPSVARSSQEPSPSAVPPPSPAQAAPTRIAMATARPPGALGEGGAPGEEPAPSEASSSTSDARPPQAGPATSSSAWSAWSLALRPDAPPDLGVGTSAVRERVIREEGAAPDPKRVAGGLRDALDAHDRAAGLGSGGPVVQAARDATSQGLAPVNGHALFEATFDTAGKVTAVRVLDVSSDEPSWQEVATALKGALRDQTLKVPHDGQHKGGGLAVSVRVESRWQMPDGSDPDPAKVCVPPFPCNAGPRRKKIILNPLMLTAPLPAMGDKPLRVVHAYIVSERVL